MRFKLILTTALCASCIVSAQSQNPKDGTKDSRKYSNNHQRSTEDAPIFVKQLSPKNSDAESAQDARDKEEKSDAERWNANLGKATVVVLALQLIAFVWQAIKLGQTVSAMEGAAKQQTIDMDKALNVARDSAHRQLRAYVNVDEFNRDTTVQIATIFDFQITIKNFGQTPAYGTRATVTTKVEPIEWKGPFTHDAFDGTISTRILSPHQITAIRPREELTNEQLASLREGRLAIFVFGNITYRDIYDHPRETTFRVVVKLYRQGQILPVFYEEGNQES